MDGVFDSGDPLVAVGGSDGWRVTVIVVIAYIGWVGAGFLVIGRAGAKQWPGAGGVVVTGGRFDIQVVGVAGMTPTSIFFGLVTGGTQAGGVVPAGGAAGVDGSDVIGLADGRITIRGAADSVADQQHFA